MNTTTITISRPFKTKNNKEVMNVFQEIGFEETFINKNEEVVVASYNQQWNDFQYVVKEKATGKVIGGFDSYGEISDTFEYLEAEHGISFDTEKEYTDKYEELELSEYVQSMLEDGEVFILKEVSHEGLRYNNGWAIVIHKANYNKQGYDVKTFDLDMLVDDYIEEKGLKENGRNS